MSGVSDRVVRPKLARSRTPVRIDTLPLSPMSGLEQVISQALSALGGVTVENANTVLDAVSGHLLASEAQLLSTEEAIVLRSQDTTVLGYSVPSKYLPALPPSYPPPPTAFPTLAYSRLIGFIDLLNSVLLQPFQKLDSVYAREARTLLVYRNLRLECRRILELLLLTVYPSLPPEFGYAESIPGSSPASHSLHSFQESPLKDVFPTSHHTPIEVWRLFLDSPDALDLELFVPLVNAGTKLVPPFSLDSYTCHMADSVLWDERSTFSTLPMLGAVLIPAAMFYDPPNFLVREFCVQDDGVTAVSYTLGCEPESTEVTLRLPDGRSVAFIRAAPTVDRLVFSQPALRFLTSLSISDRLLRSTINILTRAPLDALTSMEIRLDGQAVDAPHASLLAYRGPKLICGKIAELKVSSAGVGAQIVSVPAGKVDGFVASAFPGLRNVSYSHRVRVEA